MDGKEARADECGRAGDVTAEENEQQSRIRAVQGEAHQVVRPWMVSKERIEDVHERLNGEVAPELRVAWIDACADGQPAEILLREVEAEGTSEHHDRPDGQQRDRDEPFDPCG